MINTYNMLRVGSVLHGTYRIDGYLSSGGFGNTYVATNIQFEERVAVKEFFMKGINQRNDDSTTVSVSNADNRNTFEEQREKFKKEARRLRRLHSAHIVAVHDLFEENGTAYYVMDYIDGESLEERLKRSGKLPETEVIDIFRQTLDAIETAHNAEATQDGKRGILHLDLKPANIMVDKTGCVKIIDFGASKQISTYGGATTTTAISYTMGYAPREQMEQNLDKFGPWTDIYALGATLYKLLTDQKPPLPSDIDDDHSEDKHFSLPFPNEISEETKECVLWMMNTNRFERPQSISDIREYFNKKGDTNVVSKENIAEETLVIGNLKVSRKQEDFCEDKSSVNQVNGKIDNNSTSGHVQKQAFYVEWIIIFVIFVVTIAGWLTYRLNTSLDTNLSEYTDTLCVDSACTDSVCPYVDSLIYVKTPVGVCNYIGETDINGAPDGIGTAVFLNLKGQEERVYEGEWRHGSMDGEGRFEWIGGQIFTGTLKNNFFSEGKLLLPDGSYYVGTFHVVTDSNGKKTADVYNGEWYTKTGTPDGKVVNGR